MGVDGADPTAGEVVVAPTRPATNTRFEVGLNMKGVDGTDRLIAQPAGGMCQYKVKLADAGEVDEALTGWLREAYEQAG